MALRVRASWRLLRASGGGEEGRTSNGLVTTFAWKIVDAVVGECARESRMCDAFLEFLEGVVVDILRLATFREVVKRIIVRR